MSTDILFIGRGGQGAFTAARLLGAAYTGKGENHHALAFPSFGPERRGAPVRVFVKLDMCPIRDRSEINRCDFLVCLDETLFNPQIEALCKPEGRILLNTKHNRNTARILCLDADSIALAHMGVAIVNTVMLGALASIYNGIELVDLQKALSSAVPPRALLGNLAVIQAAYQALAGEAAS
jgi:pyruvate ferredoxin oxidoreductase gamma subunit